MRSREQKRAHHGLTDFEKGRRGSLLRRDFFLFRLARHFFGTLLGTLWGGFHSSKKRRRHFNTRRVRNNTTHTHLRERKNVKDDSPRSDVVEARHRVKRRTVRASEFFFVFLFGCIVLVRVNVIPSNQSFDILVFEKYRARGERGEESDGKRQSIAKRDRGRA